jgi:hypothetical protein
MKTPQQLSAEILQKISARKAKQKRMIRNLQRCAAVILIAAVALPISLHLHWNATLKNTAPSGGNMNGAMPETNAPMKPNNSSSAGSMGGDSANADTMTPGQPEFDEENTENDGAMEEVTESVEESTKEEA